MDNGISIDEFINTMASSFEALAATSDAHAELQEKAERLRALAASGEATREAAETIMFGETPEKDDANDLGLNDNEMEVLRALAYAAEDNGDDFGFTDEARVAGLSKHQIAGYISALKAKGVFAEFVDHSQDPGTACNAVQFSLTPAAYRALGMDDVAEYRESCGF